MARLKDTEGLFGKEMGSSTCEEVTCQVCDQHYPDAGESGNGIPYAMFAGLTVCGCCFEKIEQEVLHRMPQILRWYEQHLALQKKGVANARGFIPSD